MGVEIAAVLIFAIVFTVVWYLLKLLSDRLRARKVPLDPSLGLSTSIGPLKETSARKTIGAETLQQNLGSGREVRLPPTSLLILLPSPLELSGESVAAAIHKAWGATLSEDEDDPAHWLFGQTGNICTFSVDGTVYTIVSLGEPYPHDRDWYVTDETPPELLSAWRAHHAWVTVDVVQAGEPDAKDADVPPLDKIGKLLAELAPPDTLAVVNPARRVATAWDEEVRMMLRRRPATEVVRGPLTSLVLLLREPREVATDMPLTDRVEKAWGVRMAAESAIPTADFCRVDPGPAGAIGYIQRHGIRLAVLAPPGKYVRDLEEQAQLIANPRIRGMFLEHAAWLAIDMFAAPVGVEKTRVYQIIGSLLATYVDSATLLLYAPEYQRALPPTRDVLAKLSGENPLATLFQQPPELK